MIEEENMVKATMVQATVKNTRELLVQVLKKAESEHASKEKNHP